MMNQDTQSFTTPTDPHESSDSDSGSSQGRLKKLKRQEQWEQLSKKHKLLATMLKVGIDQNARIKKIQKVLDEGADVNIQDHNYNDNTPLHIAIQNNEPQVVEFLLKRGADAQIKNRQGALPVMLALKRGQKAAEMVTILMQALPESLRPDIVLFAALLRKGITQQERIMAIQNALDQGAHINAQDSSDQENTVLHQAALKGEPEVVQFLLAHGSDAQIKNRKQEISLMSWLKRPMGGTLEFEKHQRITSLLEQTLPAPLRANSRLFVTRQRSIYEYFNQLLIVP